MFSGISQWFNKNRKEILFGLVILTLAIFLRIYNLTILPIFGDEAIYIRWSQVMSAVPSLRFLPLSDGKQPLFMWVLMFLVRRFADPLFIGRLTSALYGIGTIFGIFATTQILFRSVRVSLIASTFWAISPYSLFYDRLALVDSMLTAFGIWTLFFAIYAARTLRLDFALLAGFSLGGALLTKSPGVFFALMLPMTWIVSRWPKRKKGTAVGKKELVHLVKVVALSLATLMIALLMYNILRLGENFHMIPIRNKDYIYPISHVFEDPRTPLITNLKSVFEWLWILGPSALVLLIIIALLDNIKISFLKLKEKAKPEVALIFIWSITPILISAVYAKVFADRYILFTLPTLFILASLAFWKFETRKEILKKLIVLIFLLFVFRAVLNDIKIIKTPENAHLPPIVKRGFLQEWTAGYGIKEVSEILKEEYKSNPDQKIVVGTEGFFGTLPDGLQLYLNDIPEITIIGVGQPVANLPQSLVDSKKAGNKTYLLVNNTRFLAKPETLGLKLLAAYPKTPKADGSREALLFFEVRDEVKL